MLKEKQKVYRIYRPVMDYEESEETIMIVGDRALAEKIVGEVMGYYRLLSERYKRICQEMDNISARSGINTWTNWNHEVFSDVNDQHKKLSGEVHDRENWPYGICLSCDISNNYSEILEIEEMSLFMGGE